MHDSFRCVLISAVPQFKSIQGTLQTLISSVDTYRFRVTVFDRGGDAPMQVTSWPLSCPNVNFSHDYALTLSGLRWHVSTASNNYLPERLHLSKSVKETMGAQPSSPKPGATIEMIGGGLSRTGTASFS
jgi:hypothetical protein